MVFLVFNHFFLLILRQNDIFLRLAFRGSLRRTIRVGAREVKSQGTCRCRAQQLRARNVLIRNYN